MDDVDRTDFSDPSMNADLDKVRVATGPHSEIESASLLVDLVNDSAPLPTAAPPPRSARTSRASACGAGVSIPDHGTAHSRSPPLARCAEVPVGATSYLLVSLANLGPKMFNVSAITGVLSSADGKEVQKFAKREYGDSLGPRDQRFVLYGFTPSEETALGAYKLEFKIFYNNREKDQFVDTVFSESKELVRAATGAGRVARPRRRVARVRATAPASPGGSWRVAEWDGS